MRNITRVDEVVDDEGFIVTPSYSMWACDCGEEVYRYRGESDVSCGECGAWYNASGQRLRDDWRGNPSNYDDEIGDLEGYERQHAYDC